MAAPAGIGKRLAWLLVCLAVGAVVGVAGSTITGAAYWYGAIPIAVAVGWLVFANPSACETQASSKTAATPTPKDLSS
jgi:hypothetical protein